MKKFNNIRNNQLRHGQRTITAFFKDEIQMAKHTKIFEDH